METGCISWGSGVTTPSFFSAADFLLLPSLKEGLPLSILEAQATKVPVLAAPTAGIPEVIRDAVTGFLIPAADAEAYACRIEQLLAHPDLAQGIAEAAFQRVTREHNWESYCRRVSELYDELLEQRALPSHTWSLFPGRRTNASRTEPMVALPRN